MSTIIGIDLGTTNSVVAALEDGRPRAIAVDGHATMPSVVLYRDDGTVVTGRTARNLALQFPSNCVSSIKRQMGRAAAVAVGGQQIAPSDVSAEILRALRLAAEAELGQVVDRAVITVPAYFDDAQRRATLAAGEAAGLTVLRLLNEPTAASLVYEHAVAAASEPEIMLVYDLGGGTFDVSVLEVFGGVREVRSSTGNSALGGDDFDGKLVQRFVDEIRTRHHVDVSADAIAMARLRRAAEEAKIELSSAVQTHVRQEFLTEAQGTPVHLDVEVSRREFEAMVEALLESTIELSRRALDEARLGPDEPLRRVCLVGGSTRIPLVRRLLEAAFQVEIHEEIDPDLAVGLGAAIQSGLLQDQPVGRVLVDVSTHSLGVRTADQLGADGDADAFSPVLRRNTALPAERTEEFFTMVSNQPAVRVEVLQGESPQASRNVPVGGFEFELRPAPAGSPVHVRFAYDLDGVIHVTASQPGGGDKTVQLKVPDGARTGPALPDTAVARRAQKLLESLPPDARARLQTELDTYRQAATPEARAEAEEALLDLFLEHDAG